MALLSQPVLKSKNERRFYFAILGFMIFYIFCFQRIYQNNKFNEEGTELFRYEDGIKGLEYAAASATTSSSGSGSGSGRSNDVHNIQNESQRTMRRPIRILSLGGSITHGAKLDSQSLAYPSIISPPLSSSSSSSSSKSQGVIAKNLAVRATGSEYASRCIQSMIKNSNSKSNSNDEDYDDEGEEFDVILLEYSLNGMENIDLLLRRLRDRYPSAIIIYIHLWSLRTLSEDKETGKVLQDIVMNDNEGGDSSNTNKNVKLSLQELEQKFIDTMADENRHWKWNDSQLRRSNERREIAIQLMQKANGFIWTFPLSDDPKSMMRWFASDVHHLNENGHAIVAEGIRNLLLQHSIMTTDGWFNPHHNTQSSSSSTSSPSSLKGSWGRGDQCYTWFETGISPLDHNGGKMKLFVKPDKFAHQINLEDGKSSISFENRSKWTLPLHIMHMVWLEDKYPKTKVEVHHLESTDDSDVSSMILNPIHERKGMRVWHITSISEVGVAKPGWNSVIFEVLEKKVQPIRIVGITMCGACQDLEGKLS